MTPLVLVGAILAAPILLLSILRANAMMVFLSLCLGSVLVQFIGDEVSDTVGILALGTGQSNQMVVSLCLLFAPAVLTTVFTIASIHGHSRRVFNFVLSIAVAFLVVMLAEPYLSESIRSSLESNIVWRYVQKLETMVIVVGSLITLFLLWMQRPRHHEHGGHHKKH